jgi:hypothetical protein
VPRARKKRPPVPRLAMSVGQFCEAVQISEDMYWKMKRAGGGPRELRVGRAVRITPAAAKEWVRSLEAAGNRPEVAA